MTTENKEKKSCFLWFHDWDKWSESQPMKFTYEDKFTGRERKDVGGFTQHRYCKRCNELQIKNII